MHNEFDQYQGQQAPQPSAPERKSYSADDLGYPQGQNFLKNPVVATAVLLVTAGIFAGIVMMALPSDKGGEVMPVIRAEVTPYKSTPEERGGLQIANMDSTIFAEVGMEQPSMPQAQGRVENLLEDLEASETSLEAAPSMMQERAKEPAVTPVAEPPSQPKSVLASLEKPESLHPAGASPETIAFVKSVLEEQKADAAPVKPSAPAAAEASAEKAAEVAKAEPAAGVPATRAAEKQQVGTHYVQLSSITDESRAASEWANLQGKYPFFAGSDYRVQRKDLGEKGVFYRVQAGSYSKDQAFDFCRQVKKAGGGCFLVSK